MTDFLGNLILRSAGDPSPLSVLQPRLPSLFEPAGGGNEVPASPDPDGQEMPAPATDIQSTAPSTDGLPDPRPALSDELVVRERKIVPAADRNLLPIEQAIHPKAVERRQEVIQSLPSAATAKTERPVQVLFKHLEPQRTILPRPESRAVRREPPVREDHHAVTAKEPVKITRAEPLFTTAQNVDMSPLPVPQTQDSFQAAIRPVTEEADDSDPMRSFVDPVSIKAESKPAVVLQPFPVASRPVQRGHPEPDETHMAERIVEIHIGRIEVRAAPTPGPAKRAPQKTGTMSLDEYLRSRPGGRP